MEELKLYLKGIVCVTCLSSDRELRLIEDISQIKEMLPNIRLNSTEDKMCWECRSILRKFMRFRQKASEAQKVFDSFVEGNSTLIKSFSNLKWEFLVDGTKIEMNYQASRVEIQSVETEQTATKEEMEEVVNNCHCEEVKYEDEEQEFDASPEGQVKAEEEEYLYDAYESMEFLEDEFADNLFQKLPDNLNIDDDETNKITESALQASLQELTKQRNTSESNDDIEFQIHKTFKIPKSQTISRSAFNEETSNSQTRRKTSGTDKPTRGTDKKQKKIIGNVVKKNISTTSNIKGAAIKKPKGKKTKEDEKSSQRDNAPVTNQNQNKLVQGDLTEKGKGNMNIEDHKGIGAPPTKKRRAVKQKQQVKYLTSPDAKENQSKLIKEDQKEHNITLDSNNGNNSTTITEKYNCNDCGKSFQDNYQLNIHVKSHNLISNIYFDCKVCDYRCVTRGTLEKHLQKHDRKRAFECNICKRRFSSKDYLNIHLRTHTGEKPYQCDICEYRCIAKGLLKIHKRTHTGVKPYKCCFCEYRCNQKFILKRHLRTHTGEKPYQCCICKYRFNEESKLKIHLTTHTGEKPHQCNFCGYRCNRKGNLNMHLRTHTGEKPYQCDFCEYSCNRKAHLKRHLRIHTGEKPYQCDICEYRCITIVELKRHLRTHTGDKPYQCDICEYRCISKGSLKIHLKTHTGEKPYQCDICEYRCITIVELKIHLRTHTGDKPYQCDICEYRFKRKANLKRHLITHTGEKPYQCDNCEYRCRNKDYFKIHLRAHTGEKPYQCDFCEYRCNQKGHLNAHLRTHTGEKPYKCVYCEFRCNKKVNLNTHLRIHTGEKPYKCVNCEFRCNRKNNLNKHLRTHTREIP